MDQEIDDEPGLCWWVPYILYKRDRIIAAVNTRVLKVTRKYGIEVPTSMDHVKSIDEINGNILWMDAINKDMEKNLVAFNILETWQTSTSFMVEG